MAAIGDAWVDGAWVEAAWVPAAWEGGSEVDDITSATELSKIHDIGISAAAKRLLCLLLLIL